MRPGHNFASATMISRLHRPLHLTILYQCLAGRYNYGCCNLDGEIPDVTRSICYVVRTCMNDDGKGNMVNRDRHNVECNNGFYITSFKLQRNRAGNKYQYEYKCCAFMNTWCTPNCPPFDIDVRSSCDSNEVSTAKSQTTCKSSNKNSGNRNSHKTHIILLILSPALVASFLWT